MTDNLLEMPTTENTEKANKPQEVPEKFWNAEKQEIRVDALLQSYLDLEKHLSKMIPMPESDDDKMRLFKILGLPDTADQYNITVKDDVLEIDPELNARLHAKGFTNTQVQEIYDLATEKFVPMILEMAAEFQADRELERLVAHFGGHEKWAVIAKQLQEFGRKNLPPSAYDGLCCSYEGVMSLYAMMKGGIKAVNTDGGVSNKARLDEKELRQLMQQPQYWRDRDPSFIARVSEGFQKLYGE